MATKPNKKQVSNKVIKLIKEKELDNIQEAVDYLHQNKNVTIVDFIGYLHQYHTEKAETLYFTEKKLLKVVAKGFGPDALVHLIDKFRDSNEILEMQKFFKNPIIENASDKEKDALNSALLKKYGRVRSNYNYFTDFLSFIDGLDGEFLAKEIKKPYKEENTEHPTNPHFITSVCLTIRQYNDYLKKDSQIFVLSDIFHSVFNKVAKIDKDLPTKFLSENMGNSSRFTNMIYSTSLEDLQYFIDSNKKFLNDDLTDSIKSNSILKQCFSTKDISDKTYQDSLTLISDNKFNPSLSYFVNDADVDMLEGKALPKFNTKNFNLALEILKTNKLPNNYNSVKEGDRYSEGKYTSTAFEIFINKSIKDISNISYDNALSKSNASLTKIKSIKNPSPSMIKEELLDSAEKFLKSANQLIGLGFEPTLCNSSISQINNDFLSQLQGENIRQVNHEDSDYLHTRATMNDVRHMMADLAHELRVRPDKFMMLADYIEDAIQPQKSNKDKKEQVYEPQVNHADREANLLKDWNQLLEKVTRLTPEQKEAKKVKPKM
jgi:hypothetical protein